MDRWELEGCPKASQKRWEEHGSIWLRRGVLVGTESRALGCAYTKATPPFMLVFKAIEGPARRPSG